jgi:hypothetical protein
MSLSTCDVTAYSPEIYDSLQKFVVTFEDYKHLNGSYLHWTTDQYPKTAAEQIKDLDPGYSSRRENIHHMLHIRRHKFYDIPTPVLGSMSGYFFPDPTGNDLEEDRKRRFEYIKIILNNRKAA